MNDQTTSKTRIQHRDIFLRIIAYGIPITLGILGFVLGWWEKLATGN